MSIRRNHSSLSYHAHEHRTLVLKQAQAVTSQAPAREPRGKQDIIWDHSAADALNAHHVKCPTQPHSSMQRTRRDTSCSANHIKCPQPHTATCQYTSVTHQERGAQGALHGTLLPLRQSIRHASDGVAHHGATSTLNRHEHKQQKLLMLAEDD